MPQCQSHCGKRLCCGAPCHDSLSRAPCPVARVGGPLGKMEVLKAKGPSGDAAVASVTRGLLLVTCGGMGERASSQNEPSERVCVCVCVDTAGQGRAGQGGGWVVAGTRGLVHWP